MELRSPRWSVLGLVILLGLATFLAWWSGSAKRTLEAFVAAASQGRIAEAAHQLTPPCALESLPDGGLRVVDAAGRETVVAAGYRLVVSGDGSARSLGERCEDVLQGRMDGELSIVRDGVEPSRAVVVLVCERDGVRIDAVVVP